MDYYPIDFGAITKGSWLETQELERALGVGRGGPSWQFALMRLCEQIRENSGALACIKNDRIRVMDDAEACEWTFREQERHVRGLRRSAQRRSLIDRSSMDDSRRALAEARDRITTATAIAASQAQRKMRRELKAGAKKELRG